MGRNSSGEPAPVIVFDAGIGVVPLEPNAREANVDRVARLAASFKGVRTRFMIPRPVLRHALALAEAGRLADPGEPDGFVRFQIMPVDTPAGIAFAEVTRDVLDTLDQTGGLPDPGAAEASDRQIVALARPDGVEFVFCDEADVRSLARRIRRDVIGLAGIPLPPDDPRYGLFDIYNAAPWLSAPLLA
jgi:hypothetical protein